MVASQYLRFLNARSLLLAERQGRWVRYRPAANRSVGGYDALLAALKGALSAHGDPVETVFRLVTAFTHPRRLRLIRALTAGPASVSALMRVTHISRQALTRHLAKLQSRGFVIHLKGAYRLECPRRRLAGILLTLAKGTLPHEYQNQADD